MDKKSAILITGGTGFIGSYIIRLLLREGYENIYGSKRTSSKFDLLGEAQNKVKWLDLDILDVVAMHEAMANIHTVIHAAALVSFDPHDYHALMRTNVEGTANVVNACIDQNVKRLIHISSVGVFPRKNQNEVIDESKEWEQNKLTSDYAISKYLGELEVWRGSVEGLVVAVLNPSLVLGSGDWNQGTANIFKKLYQGLRFYPNGSTGVVDVRDVARAAILLLQRPINNERLIISAENLTYKELFTKMAKHLNRRQPSIKLNRFFSTSALLGAWFLSKTNSNAKVISRASLKNAEHRWSFNHDKSRELLGISYRSIDACITESCQQFIEASENGTLSKYLPL